MREEREIIITEEDLNEALKELGTYIDVTPEDLKLLFDLALRIAKERCLTSWIAQDIMTRDVISVKPDTDIYEAGKLMIRHRISGLPVIDDEGILRGIITEADLLTLAGIPKGHVFNEKVMSYIGRRASKPKRVSDVMTKDVISVTPSTSVRTIAKILHKKGIKRVPVVDIKGKVIGIVSRTDILRVLCSEETEGMT